MRNGALISGMIHQSLASTSVHRGLGESAKCPYRSSPFAGDSSATFRVALMHLSEQSAHTLVADQKGRLK